MYAEYLLKKESRGYLSNNWGKAISVTILMLLFGSAYSLICSIIFGILNLNIFDKFTTSITDLYINQGVIIETIKNINPVKITVFLILIILVSIAFLLVNLPLTLGIKRFYYFVTKGQSPSVIEVFYFFKTKENFFRALKFTLCLAGRYLLWYLACVIPGLAITFISGMLAVMPSQNTSLVLVLLTPIGLLATIIGLVLFLCIWLRYFLSSYLLVSNEEISPSNCLKISFNQMKGYRMNVVKLYITFILWILACFFVLPILYVYPYLATSTTNCQKWLLVKINHKSEQNQVTGQPE